jgi:hypothetical protein
VVEVGAVNFGVVGAEVEVPFGLRAVRIAGDGGAGTAMSGVASVAGLGHAGFETRERIELDTADAGSIENLANRRKVLSHFR